MFTRVKFVFFNLLAFSAWSQPAVQIGDPHGIVYDLSLLTDETEFVALIENRVELWNYESRSLIRNWEAPNVISLSVKGFRIAAGSRDGILRIWDALSGTELKSIMIADSPITCICWKDSVTLFAGTDSGEILKFDIHTGNAVEVFKIRNAVTALAAPSRSPVLVFGDAAGNLTLLNWQSGKVQDAVKAHKSWIRTIRLMESTDEILFSVGDDGFLKRWSLREGIKLAMKSKLGFGTWALSVDAQRNNTNGLWTVATGLSDGAMRITTSLIAYKYNTGSMVNAVAIVTKDLPMINVLAGTHGSGIQLISGNSLKVSK